MLRVLFGLLFLGSACAGTPNDFLFKNGFEPMTATAWLDPYEGTYHRGFDVPTVDYFDLGDLIDANDELFETIGQIGQTTYSPNAFIPTLEPGDDWEYHKLVMWFRFSSASIPVGAKVTGVEVRAAMAATAREKNGAWIPATAAQMQFVDDSLYIETSTGGISGSVASGAQFVYGNDGAEVDDGVDFLVREWGGVLDDWGSPALPSEPDGWNTDFAVRLVCSNNGPYRLQAYLDQFQIRIHYVPADNIVNMQGTGSVSATVLRGIKGSTAMVGVGDSSLAANAVSQQRNIVSAFVGQGETSVSVRRDEGGTIYVYGEPTFRGLGSTEVSTVTRAIPVPGNFVGKGEATAAVQRGIVLEKSDTFRRGHFVVKGDVVASIFRLRKLTSAFAGLGSATVAADALQRFIKIVSAFAGLGNATASVLRIKPIVMALEGLGAASATIRRAIKITGAFAGLGSVVAESYSGTRARAPDERCFKVPAHGGDFVVPAIDNKFKVT